MIFLYECKKTIDHLSFHAKFYIYLMESLLKYISFN